MVGIIVTSELYMYPNITSMVVILPNTSFTDIYLYFILISNIIDSIDID